MDTVSDIQKLTDSVTALIKKIEESEERDRLDRETHFEHHRYIAEQIEVQRLKKAFWQRSLEKVATAGILAVLVFVSAAVWQLIVEKIKS